MLRDHWPELRGAGTERRGSKAPLDAARVALAARSSGQWSLSTTRAAGPLPAPTDGRRKGLMGALPLRRTRRVST